MVWYLRRREELERAEQKKREILFQRAGEYLTEYKSRQPEKCRDRGRAPRQTFLLDFEIFV